MILIHCEVICDACEKALPLKLIVDGHDSREQVKTKTIAAGWAVSLDGKLHFCPEHKNTALKGGGF